MADGPDLDGGDFSLPSSPEGAAEKESLPGDAPESLPGDAPSGDELPPPDKRARTACHDAEVAWLCHRQLRFSTVLRHAGTGSQANPNAGRPIWLPEATLGRGSET